jgi:2-polyprenyl-3-methyl-5-hydroxy-6-metoxy-1,4-benzoquinol methylase
VNAREFLEELTAGISRDFPMLARGLLANQLTADDPLWQWAALATEHVLRITGHDDRRISECAEAFVVTSLDFLRLQARFMKTGRYSHADASESLGLYSDAERMTEYLDGLALTYAMWPNHTRMLRFFVTEFVPLVPRAARILEIGPGHGLLASVLLRQREDVQYVGVDISPRSISYSAAAFAAAGIAEGRYDLVVANATDRNAPLLSHGSFEAAVCCEVLEHVDDPGSLLSGLNAQMQPGAAAFVSTVANMEAEDHVYLFHDVQEIRSLIVERGFTVHMDQPLELAGSQGMTPTPLNYSAIAFSVEPVYTTPPIGTGPE